MLTKIMVGRLPSLASLRVKYLLSMPNQSSRHALPGAAESDGGLDPNAWVGGGGISFELRYRSGTNLAESGSRMAWPMMCACECGTTA